MEEISSGESKVLRYLSENEADGYIAESGISIEGLDDRAVSSSVSWLESKKLVDCKRESVSKYTITDEARSYMESGFPEEKLVKLVGQGTSSIKDIMRKLGPAQGKIALAQIAKFGIKPSGGSITISNPSEILNEVANRRNGLATIEEGKIPEKKIMDHLRSRGNLVVEKKSQTRRVKINASGSELISHYSTADRIDNLTPEMLLSGSWKGKEFRKYDLNSRVSALEGGYFHPLTVLINRIREIFFDMGFTEMTGNYVEHALWNMDALFIPQDHPARELQDTFYLESDHEFRIQDPEIAERIKKVHEKGFGKYTGWRNKWDMKEAEKLLLRTHTTVSTARYLYEHNEPPVAVFSVERVFRHESVDWKHLAEFYQIEGSVYSPDANLSTLKWLLGEFYGKLGFDEVKLIPSYYPYTEPSMDVVVRVGNREVELGGSGIFRPEVEKILGLNGHAIAWGLGLERLAFLYYQMEDIRGIYNSDIDWLRNFRVNP